MDDLFGRVDTFFNLLSDQVKHLKVIAEQLSIDEDFKVLFKNQYGKLAGDRKA